MTPDTWPRLGLEMASACGNELERAREEKEGEEKKDGVDERDDGGIHELHAKVAMQDALTRHWRFYIEQHKDEYDGYYPFVYRASLDAQRRQDAEQGGR